MQRFMSCLLARRLLAVFLFSVLHVEEIGGMRQLWCSFFFARLLLPPTTGCMFARRSLFRPEILQSAMSPARYRQRAHCRNEHAARAASGGSTVIEDSVTLCSRDVAMLEIGSESFTARQRATRASHAGVSLYLSEADGASSAERHASEGMVCRRPLSRARNMRRQRRRVRPVRSMQAREVGVW